MAVRARKASARATAIAALAAFGATLLLLVTPLVFGLPYHGIDLTRGDLGAICAVQRQLQDDASLWLSPYLGNGSPLLSNPQAQLVYPLRWLVLAFPADVAASLGMVLHMAIGAAGAAWLARTFRGRPSTSFCAGLAFAASGTALDAMSHSVFILDVAWIPVAWAALRRALHRGRLAGPWPVSALGTALTAMLVGGEPQGCAMIAAVLVVEGAAHLARPRATRAKLTDLGLLLVVVGASFLCGLLVWGPGLAELALTGRAARLGDGEALHWSFDAPAWLGAVLPHGAAFIDPLVYFHSIFEGSAGAPIAWNPAPYVGAVVVVAALLALSVRRLRLGVLVGVLAVLAALGKHTAFLPLLQLLAPPLSRFRYPSKYLVLADVALVVVGVLLFECLRRSARARRLFAASLVPVVVACAALVLFCVLRGDVLDEMAALLRPLEESRAMPRASEVALQAARHGAVFAALALFASLRRPTWLPVIVVVDLLVAAPGNLHVGPPLSQRTSPLLALEQHDGPAPILCVDPSLDGVATYPTRDSGEAPSRWHADAAARAVLVRELQACDGLRAAVAYVPLATRVQAKLLAGVRARSAVAARALGCTHLVVNGPLAEGAARSIDLASLGFTPKESTDFVWTTTRVFELEGPVPDAFIAREATLLPSEDAVLAKVRTARDAGALVAVLDDPLGRLPAGAPLPSGDDVTTLERRDLDTDAIDLRATGTGGAVLGARTAFHVGWTARQAGVALPVIRSSGQHVAVVIDDVARGKVELRYENPRLLASALAACVGGLLIAAAAWCAGHRRHPRSLSSTRA